jgi:rhamnosyltransferase
MLGCYFPVSLLLPRLMNKIVVVNVDGLEWNRRKFGPVLRFLLKQVEKLNAKISSQVIVDSRLIGRYYDLNYGISSVYIPNGIREIKPLEEKWLKRFGLVKNDYYLVLARLEPENNVDMIIREFKNSSSEKKLAIVGPLTNSGYVKQLLGYKDDSVVFLGGIFEPRLQRMLRHNCFAYIHGHEVGGANPSLIEALSCNNLILALDCSYNREVGEDAAIYFKKDPGDLREKIVDLERSEDCERSIRSRPYSVYLRKYTVEKMVDGFEELVRTLMHGH